jgi:RHS repeat-associated protein
MGVYPQKKARFYTYICINMTHFRQSTSSQLPAYQYSYGHKTASGVCLQNIFDYSPFGVALDGRTIENDFYRRGFNGMEKDDEVKGSGNSYTTEFRQYDPRLGRFIIIDPLIKKFPMWTPYCISNNNTTRFVDPKGDAPQDWIRRKNSNRWEYDSRVQSQKNATDKYGEGTEYKNDDDTYHGFLGTKDIGAVKLNTGGLQTWDGGSYQNNDLNPNLSWNLERLLNPFTQNWYNLTSKGNTVFGVGAAMMEWSSSSFRLTSGVASGSSFSPKWYSSGWTGGSRAGITTYNAGSVAIGLGRVSLGLGVGMDAIGVLNYYTEGADSRNSVHPAKAIVNTGFGVLGLKWNPVAAILYSGVDAFYPGGWTGDQHNEGALRKLSGLTKSNQEIVPNFNLHRDMPGGY